MPTEREMIEQLRRGKVSLPPLSFHFVKCRMETDGNCRLDTLVEESWQDMTIRFVVKCKSLSRPKAFQDGLNMLKSSSIPKGYRPILIMPFLSEQQLQELEQEGDQMTRNIDNYLM